MLKKIKYLLLSKKLWKKIFAYWLLVFFMVIFKDFLLFFLITFLFSYLLFSLAKYISYILKSYIASNNKFVNIFLSEDFLVTLVYVVFLFLIIYFISNLIPILITELSHLSNNFPIIDDYINQIMKPLKQVQQTKEIVSSDLDKFVNDKNIEIVVNIVNHIKHFWWELLKFVMSFILSYFFVIDRKKLVKYLEWIKKSTLSFLYEEYNFLFKKIARWFLLVFRAQIKIAIVNTLLTWIWLHIISLILWQTIPYLWLLTLFVFIFSFVPVLWVVISSIPIWLIVYNIWWFIWLLYVLSLILIIHSIEAYFLNPRFISDEVELPVSLTFMLLLIWEHIFWPIWLIVSVPLFYIFIEILKDFDTWISENLKWF